MTSLATELQTDLAWFIDHSRPPVTRTMAEWVEDELVLPDGPYKGEKYKHHRHPVSKPWFDAVDSGNWNRFAATGPTQNGKTLLCYVAPVLYHLFELKETVIIGLPTLTMAQDKWTEDFLPAIEACQYRNLLPTKGEGSKGGMVKRGVKFRNGATLRFMTAGGDDKQRSAFTSRVLAITETDGMDESGGTSREADKIKQMEGRTRAFGRTGKRVFLECTVSIEQGRIWQEVNNGTNSKLYRPCPHCGEYVFPDREHLVGWQEATNEHEAADNAKFICPSCEEGWTEEDRKESAKKVVLVHEGQKALPGGNIVGEAKRTQTFGLRWSAIDNPFVTMADLGAEEWLSARDRNRDNAEREQRQFVWALPYEPPDVDLTPLEVEKIESRTKGTNKCVVPDDCLAITVGVDTADRRLDWAALALLASGEIVVIDYGEQATRSDEIGVIAGLKYGLGQLHKYFSHGWNDSSGKNFTPRQVWIDSGFYKHKQAVYDFCLEVAKKAKVSPGKEIYRPTKGYGEGQKRKTKYIAPKKAAPQMYIGHEFHMNWQEADQIYLVHMNGDYWKSELHQRLAIGDDQANAITLYRPSHPLEHRDYSEQLTAENQVEKWIEGRGGSDCLGADTPEESQIGCDIRSAHCERICFHPPAKKVSATTTWRR